jgi:hypothetical protein
MDEEPKRTFDNTSSSYLSLKAELLRKKQDVQKTASASISSSAMLDNLQSTSSSLKLKTKADLDIEVVNQSKKKKKTETNAAAAASSPSASSSISREDEIAYAKSRAILEAKSKLYDQIMSNSGDARLLAEDDGNDDDDNDKSFLVDFGRKIYETNQRNDNKVEYTDSFGRTRLVTSDEYEQLKSTEKKKPQEKVTSESEMDRVERLHREQMRSKWEAEMEELRNKTHVHYQDVLFDEKREHGVGFYRFSTDDNQRAEQMTTLNELRANTISEQNKFMQEKERKQSSMSERLNKIRLRKAKEMGIDLSGNNQNQKESIPTLNDHLSDKKKEETSVDKTDDEQLKEQNIPQIIQLPPPQRSEQVSSFTELLYFIHLDFFSHWKPLVLNRNNHHLRLPIHPLPIHFRECVLITLRHHQNLLIRTHIHLMNINFCYRIFSIVQIYIFCYANKIYLH